LVNALSEEYAEVPAALARLSNLQHLQLDSRRGGMPGSCLAGVAQLSKLTQLQIGNIGIDSLQSDVHEPLQQLLAQPLPLRLLEVDMQELQELDLTALTQLEELVTDGFNKWSKLPCQLRSVKLTGVRNDGTSKPLKELQQLQRLDACISVDSDATKQILKLAPRLPRLTHLGLSYTYAWDAVAASHTWRKLPQLRELSFDYQAGIRVHLWQTKDIVSGVAAATSLTKLELESFSAIESGESEAEEQDWGDCEVGAVAVCRQLSKLTGLRDLSFTKHTMLKPGDALWLTALTNLTRLVLFNMRDGVGDAAAAAIASSLTQLRHVLGGVSWAGAVASWQRLHSWCI
jgi:hypothetical protein